MDYDEDPRIRGIIAGIIAVHKQLGPGFLESVYRNALCLELGKRGFDVKAEHEIEVYYDGEIVGKHRLDLFVDNEIILELKTVEQLGKAHYAQTRSYARAAGKQFGMLVNFSGVKADYRRVDI